jgi:uncharacterized delta-60 repeat protein
MTTIQLLKRRWFLAALFLLPAFCIAQVTEEWVARYNGPANGIDEARSLAVDDAGNVYVTGGSYGIGTASDYATIKYNSAGIQQWVARFNGSGNSFDYANELVIDNSGNVYVTGGSTGIGTGLDYTTIKYNNAGTQQWVAHYNGPGNGDDEAQALKVDSFGNVYITGRSEGIGSGFDYATIKYNAAGVQQWVSRYNGPGNGFDAAQALAINGEGNVYITGRSTGSGTGEDYATIKYNSTGVQQWVARYDGGGNGFDFARDIVLDKSGNIYVTGSITRGSIIVDEEKFPLTDFGTIKYNSNGDQLWVATYDGGGDDGAVAVGLDALENVYVTGSISNSPPGLEEPDRDYGTIKYTSAGVQLWVAQYGPPPGEDFNEFSANAHAVDSAGNVYVTGQSGDVNYATVKFNTNGQLEWAVIYNNEEGLSNEAAFSIAVDKANNVYVTGWSDGDGTTLDYATIKYNQSPQSLVACGHNGNKVLVCHKGKKTLCINASEVSNHMAHGDALGECTDGGTASVARERTDLSNATRELPAGFRTFSAPNPASAITKIYYELPFEGQVSLQVYDITGREIVTLVNGSRKAGFYTVDFDVSALQKGVYHYRITVRTQTTVWLQTKKILVVN